MQRVDKNVLDLVTQRLDDVLSQVGITFSPTQPDNIVSWSDNQHSMLAKQTAASEAAQRRAESAISALANAQGQADGKNQRFEKKRDWYEYKKSERETSPWLAQPKSWGKGKGKGKQFGKGKNKNKDFDNQQATTIGEAFWQRLLTRGHHARWYSLGENGRIGVAFGVERQCTPRAFWRGSLSWSDENAWTSLGTDGLAASMGER